MQYCRHGSVLGCGVHFTSSWQQEAYCCSRCRKSGGHTHSCLNGTRRKTAHALPAPHRSRSNFDPDPDQVADSGAMSATHRPTMLSVVPYCGGSAAASARPETENEEDVSVAETELDLRQASSEYRINAIQDQRAHEIEDSRAASTWRRTPEFDLVVLVSAGSTKPGGHWLRHEFPFLDSSGYWHRIDRIFDHVVRLKGMALRGRRKNSSGNAIQDT